ASEGEVCPICKAKMVPYRNQVVDLEKALAEVSRRLNFLPPALRGVKELESKDKMPESIVKGVLRAKHGLSVSKDGCVRFDATNAPLTHFKPDEIGTPIDKLRDLGYTNDRWKKPLSDGEQICELRVQDVVLPVKCGDRLVSVANFIDDLLSQVYDEAPFYNAKDRGDLVGHLIVGISPHTSCGILGRIIGYTEASVCYAHPFWHAAKRRDCDGDEDSTMLALDVLINFSRHYLPDRIGGLMDAPLLLTPIVDPSEVDEEAFNMEVVSRLPLSLYEASLGSPDSRRTAEMVRVAATKIGRKQQYEKFFYTMETSDIAQGGLESAYKKLETMAGKLEAQLRLADRLRAVDVRDVARRILTAHFLKDIVGNLRRFTSQTFRCRACNAKFRRAPLNGKCPRCGSPKVSKTVFQGGIEKYFRMATNIVQKYDLEPFYRDQLAMVGGEIELLFGKRREQAKLTEYT
ncbi:MAG: DNA polymerase II large subunit, partial [Candidatus Bathyarchaeia archaeon]